MRYDLLKYFTRSEISRLSSRKSNSTAIISLPVYQGSLLRSLTFDLKHINLTLIFSNILPHTDRLSLVLTGSKSLPSSFNI